MILDEMIMALTNRGFDGAAIETNDDHHGDLPQCGYYRTAGKIFACQAFKWRGTALPSQSARLTPYRYIESLRPHCGPACEGGTIREIKRTKKNKTGRNLVMCIVATSMAEIYVEAIPQPFLRRS